MSDEVKYTGPTTLAKNTALVKAELGKKLDKTGGTLTGDLTISGAWLNVKSTDTGDGNISVDGSLVAGRGVSVLNGGKSVSLVCTGDNAAKIAGSGNNCARLAVGTPTGDNDATTKAYVDGLAAAWYEVITVTSTNVSDLGYDAEEGATKYTVFFDASFDSILANLAANKPMKFNITIPDNDGDIPISFNTGYVSALGNAMYLFTGTLAGAPVVLSIGGLGSATVYLYSDYLPAPNPDGSDDGKVLAVNKHKWEMKKPKEDFVVNITFDSTSAPSIIDDANLAVFNASTDKTFAEISSAVAGGKNIYGVWNNQKWPLALSAEGRHVFRGSAQLNNLFGTVGIATATCVVLQNTCYVEVSAGELPVPALDGSDDGKGIVVSGHKWVMKKAVVDDALSDTSTNPVQNKVVKAALDGKASTAVATQTDNGLMSAEDKTKLDGIEKGANKTTVIDALDPLSHNPVSSAALFEALSKKANNTEATEQAAGLMSALDKKKLNDIEDGANKTIVDEMLSDGSTNPVQNKAVTAALASVVRETIYPIAVTATSTEWVVNNGIAYKEASADRTFDEIKAASIGNKTLVCEFERMTYSLILDSSTAFIFASYRGAVANDSQYAGLGKYPTSLISITTTGVVISRTAGDLPAVGGTDNGKMLIVSGGEWAMQRVPGTTVDAELSTTSENPVQNKTVTDALNGKLPKTGGTVTGALRTNDSFSAGGTIAFGEAPIGLSQTADGAAEIRYGSADVDDNPPPLSRLKVARPTNDDDAATKKYVDDRNDSPQFKGYVTLTPWDGTLGHGVGLSPTGSGNDYTLNISDVDEGWPTLLTGVKTPTDADTNAAATVEYVKNKISEVTSSGGVDVDNALSATSTNPVQNKVITSALNGKADKSELGNKADKTALDAKADKTALDAKMDKSGGTFTGNVYGKYFCGTWLQSTAASDLGRAPGKIAVLDDSGWVYYRTPAELLADIGAMSGGDYYTKSETDAAIAVRASTSAYGTTKLSNSTTSSSKTLAATPYAVKTALAQAKAYVDSAIAVAINSAY